MLALASLLPLLAAGGAAATSRRGSPLLNSSYVNPTFQQSRANVDRYAVETINALIARPDFPVGWIGQNAWLTIAQWDQQQGTRTFEAKFTQNETYYGTHPGGCYAYWHAPYIDCWNDDASWAALTNIQGYQAYGNASWLDNAKAINEFVTQHGFINETVLRDGYLKGTKYANATIQAVCDGQTMYGGVFEMNGAYTDPTFHEASSNTTVASASTLDYALVAALLCQLTKEQFFCNRSLSALEFSDRFLLISDSNLIRGAINGSDCELDNMLLPHKSATYAAAYTIIGNLTNSPANISKARTVFLATMNSPLWNTEQGVLTEGDGNPANDNLLIGSKGITIRFLSLAYPYMDAEMQAAITQYINIQYWSMVTKDSNNPEQPTLYGRNWTGPGYEEATGESLADSLDVLNALVWNPSSAFPNTTATNVSVITI